MNFENFLKQTKKDGSNFKGYVSLSETAETRFTMIFDDAFIDIDVQNNELIVSQIRFENIS